MEKQRRMQTEGAVESGGTWRRTDTGNKKEKKGLGCQISTLGNTTNGVFHQEIGREANAGDKVMS